MLNKTDISQLKSLKLVVFTLIFFPLFLQAQSQNRPPPEGLIISYEQGLDFVIISWEHLPELNSCENMDFYYSSGAVIKRAGESCQSESTKIKNLESGVYSFRASQEWIQSVCEYDDTEEEEVCDDEYFGSELTEPQEILVIPNHIMSASFETDLGTFTNVGTFDWLIHSGSTPSGNTGPNSGHYVYMETSSGSAYYNGNEAILESIPLNKNDNYFLSFRYNMFGANMGTLYIEILRNNSWVTIWHKVGQQSIAAWDWNEAEVEFSNAEKIRFRGRAIGGYAGDMAIDAIKVMNLSADINKRVRFIHTDILGSPISESDENGNVVN